MIPSLTADADEPGLIEGMPSGIQLMGLPYEDEKLMKVMEQVDVALRT